MSLSMGIIGAENSHTAVVAKTINVDNKARGMRVTHLWGETAGFARAAAAAGAIPVIVKDPREMLGQVDAVMIDHRDGRHHLSAAAPFIKAGIPCFIDKPLSTSTAEAKRFLKLRRKHRAAVTTFSAVPQQECVKDIKRQLKQMAPLKSLHLCGPGSHRSKYSGIFFYGIHVVDLMVELLGTAVESVQASVNGDACTMLCHYPDSLTAVLSVAPGINGWTVNAVGANGSAQLPVTMGPDGHLGTVRTIARMFRTGREPYSEARMLAPTAVLEAARACCRDQRRRRINL